MSDYGMDAIIRILMNHDGLTKAEAKARIKEAQRLMAECEYNPFEVEEIMYGELGLELDYIFALI